MINQSIIKILLIFFFAALIHKSHNKKTIKINIPIIIERLKCGGTERVISILANELSKITNFQIILHTGSVEDEEYLIENHIRRLIVYNKTFILNYEYTKKIFENLNIDIIIYNKISINQIQFLLALKITYSYQQFSKFTFLL